MPAVVSNSSPLVYLTRLGRLDLLRELYQEVLIPNAVWNEVAIEGQGRPEAAAVRRAASAGWLKVQSVTDAATAQQPTFPNLGAGEREALGLALLRNGLLLIDEAAGRAAARRLGLRHTGTLGILLEAKSRGLIPDVRSALEQLRDETNFRFTEQLFASTLRKAGES